MAGSEHVQVWAQGYKGTALSKPCCIRKKEARRDGGKLTGVRVGLEKGSGMVKL